MLVEMKCPQCGAVMQFDDSREFMFCSFCGTKIANVAETKIININKNVSGEVTYKRDTSDDPNLLISFSTVDTRLTMVSVIRETRDKWIYTNGQNMSYRLAPGRYELVIQVGKRRWSRFVYIPSDNTPVKVQVVFSGSTKILIQQPSQGTAEYHKAQMQATAMRQTPSGSGSNPTPVITRADSKPKVPIYKRWWFWLIIAVAAIDMITFIAIIVSKFSR